MPGLPQLDPALAAVAAGFIALLLVRAAFHKATDFVAFTGTLSDYRILPDTLVTPAAVMLAVVEAGLALGLLWSETRPYAGVLSAGLLAVYAAAMAGPLMQGRTEISCGCGGPTDHLSPALLIRNGLLGLIALAAAAPVTARALGWFDMASVPMAVLVLWLILETAEQALQNQAYITALNSRLKSEG